MAAITSAGSGDWNSTTPNAPWPSGVVPVIDVDTATVATGHTVTVPAGYTAGAGTSPAAGTNAVTVNGTLAIADGGSLVCRGDIGQGFATGSLITMGVGSIIEFDGSVNDVAYNLKQSYLSRLAFVGSQGNEAQLRWNAGGPSGRVTTGGSAWSVVMTDVVITRGASGADFALTIAANDDSAGTNSVLLTRVLFAAGGGVQINAVHAEARMELVDVVFDFATSLGSTAGGLGTADIYLAAGLAAATTGTRLVTRCRCVNKIVRASDAVITFDHCVAYGGVSLAVTVVATMQNSFVRHTAENDSQPLPGNFVGNYVIADGVEDNWHGMALAATQFTDDVDLTDNTFDPYTLVNTTDPGELLYVQNPASLRTVNALRNVAVKSRFNASGQSYRACGGSVFMVSTAGANSTSNINAVVEHNTAYLQGANASVASFGESSSPTANFCSSLKSNLGYFDGGGAGGGNIAQDVGGSGFTPGEVTDPVTAGAATHNGRHGLRTGSLGGNGYDYAAGGTAPGANDVTADPQFVDSDRWFGSWAVADGYATVGQTDEEQVEAGIAALWVDPTRMTALQAHVRGGQAPQNTAYRDAGADGATIGAVEGVWPSHAGLLLTGVG